MIWVRVRADILAGSGRHGAGIVESCRWWAHYGRNVRPVLGRNGALVQFRDPLVDGLHPLVVVPLDHQVLVLLFIKTNQALECDLRLLARRAQVQIVYQTGRLGLIWIVVIGSRLLLLLLLWLASRVSSAKVSIEWPVQVRRSRRLHLVARLLDHNQIGNVEPLDADGLSQQGRADIH